MLIVKLFSSLQCSEEVSNLCFTENSNQTPNFYFVLHTSFNVRLLTKSTSFHILLILRHLDSNLYLCIFGVQRGVFFWRSNPKL